MTDDQILTLENEQRRLEEETARAGVTRYWNKQKRLQEQGLETLSTPVQHVLAGYVETMAKGLTERFEEANARAGRNHAAVKLLYWADAEVLALQTLRTVLDSISQPRRFQTIALRIARSVESELRFQAFEQQAPGLYHTVQKSIKESPFSFRESYRKKVLQYSMNKYHIMWEPWTIDQLYCVGVWLLDTLIAYTGLVEETRYHTNGGRNTVLRVTPTKELWTWLEKQHGICAEMRPKMLPMVCPPVPWTSPHDGGYLTRRYKTQLVPTKSQNYLPDYSYETMPKVYDAVNWIQSTPWRINQFVYDTLSYLWDKGFELPNVTRVDAELPPKAPEGASKEELIEAKTRRREVRLHNEGMSGRRLGVTQTIGIAKQFKGKPIWFPHRLDFRGRMYAMPQYLSPQGPDYSKALLELNEGKVLTEAGDRWLAIHTANTYGVDKVDMEDRVKWVEDNWEMIESIAADPIDDKSWFEADKPFRFLAACDAIVRGRRGEPVHLMIGMDGSCNGIQHLAAMSLDEEAGALVNLVPGPVPGDIYAKVAVAVSEVVKARIADPKTKKTADGKKIRWTADEEKLYGHLWLEFEITRALAKRPTMILPYNGTPTANMKYIDEHITKVVRKTGVDVFGTRRLKAVQWLVYILGPAMKSVVKGPMEVMKWTKDVVSSVNAGKNPMIWTTPHGFTVVQCYYHNVSRRISTRVGDRIYKLALSEPTERFDPMQQRRSTSPNWIHSYDAAALHGTGACALIEGIAMGANHDEFQSHPNDGDRLGVILRDEFVFLYEGYNNMERLRKDLAHYSGTDLEELPEPPKQGRLDITMVHKSPFFFG